ncbi:helicase [Synechococcus sp. GFB01]|uniref:helicase n=1 Tax=Synechococcus sp. GFB01 TaxID=1662190 RepID=UPI00064FC718|nr:helicase [Synechococcus sp. GFB01]KMM16428.1 helicase [Synechococcus sp. GFB01]
MLEAQAHHQLKALLQREGGEPWPHHLTLSRLVARSLRRGDQTLVRLAPGSDPSWLIGLLVPLALSEARLALVVSDALRQRLLRVELPRLAAAGGSLSLSCLEADFERQEAQHARLWLLSHADLVGLWQHGRLGDRQLVIPEIEQLDESLRQALEIRLAPEHWEQLGRAHPAARASLLELHARLSRRVLAQPQPPHRLVALAEHDEAPLRQLLALLQPLPAPWRRWLESGGATWASWARVEPQVLHWTLHRQPLEPLQVLSGLLEGRGAVLIGQLGENRTDSSGPTSSGSERGLTPTVSVTLGDPPLADPLPLFAPLRQPLPNSPVFAEHLLEQSRRLVLGQTGLTVVLLDDEGLRLGLTSALAAEFGRRVVHESTAPESNGVVCARWSWWLGHHHRLPLPCQVVVGLLPIASLEDPLTAARVQALRRLGRDWFREGLLPDGLNRLQLGVAGLRRSGGRLAILDGRLRGRSWGRQVLRALEPWITLSRLLPH